MNLIDFIDIIDEFGMLKLFRRNKKFKNKLLKILQNFTITTTHLENNIELKINNFSVVGANHLFFKSGVTVERYFKQKHNLKLIFFDVPCLISTHPTYAHWPIEVLKIKNKI